MHAAYNGHLHIQKSNTMVIFINQIRMKIGVMFGNPETTTGGNALKFYSSVRLDIRRVGAIKDGDEVTLGIRPEHLSQTENGLINLKVDLVEQLGSDNLVYGILKNKKDFCYRCPGNQTIEKSSNISLNIDNNKYYIFDKSTGKRVN